MSIYQYIVDSSIRASFFFIVTIEILRMQPIQNRNNTRGTDDFTMEFELRITNCIEFMIRDAQKCVSQIFDLLFTYSICHKHSGSKDNVITSKEHKLHLEKLMVQIAANV